LAPTQAQGYLVTHPGNPSDNLLGESVPQ
jgi:hypothetical protein